MQPYFFPYIGYFQLINFVDRFVVYDDVSFINRGWVNRNHFLLNCKSFRFTVPLIEASQNKLINEICVLKDEKWKIKMLKTFELAYKKAPNYSAIYLLFDKILSSKYDTISQLNFLSIKEICEYLELNTILELSSLIGNKNNLRGQHRILDICKNMNAVHYINPIGGEKLYDKTFFNESGVSIKFLKTSDIIYHQFGGAFVSNLSIIDVLMFNDKEEINGLLKSFTLV